MILVEASPPIAHQQDGKDEGAAAAQAAVSPSASASSASAAASASASPSSLLALQRASDDAALRSKQQQQHHVSFIPSPISSGPASLHPTAPLASSSSASSPGLSGSGTVPLSSLVSLFRFFLYDYSVRPPRAHPVTSGICADCVALFSLDYQVATLNNVQGEYCTSYPPTIIVIEAERRSSSSSSPQRVNDAAELSHLFRSSRFNRVHGRFVCPVLLCGGANVSRSSTLSVLAEAMFNNVATRTKELIGTLYESMSASFRTQPQHSAHINAPFASPTDGSPQVSAREADEQLLSRLSTRFIIDLMVEHRKKKLGLSITSSEKSEQAVPLFATPTTTSSSSSSYSSSSSSFSSYSAVAGSVPLSRASSPPLPSALQPARPYSDFVIVPIPYPGCEFFRLYHANARSPVGLVFDWSQSFVDSLLQLEGVAGMGGMDLSGGAGDEDDDAMYERDTHFACWEREKQPSNAQSNAGSTAAAQAEEMADARREETKQKPDANAARSALPQPLPPAIAHSSSTSCSASSSPSATSSLPAATKVLDALHGQEEDDDGAAGRILLPSEATASSSSCSSGSQWSAYRDWTIVTLTKNYLTLLLYTLCSSPPCGLSIHCISGWDRTPLFISLLRVSLWADGEVHQSLSASGILFLTLAYDWCLFSHHLHNRHGKQEDILYFAFDFLQYITAAKFSLWRIRQKRTEESRLHRKEGKQEATSGSGSSSGSQRAKTKGSFPTPHQNGRHAESGHGSHHTGSEQTATPSSLDSSSFSPSGSARAKPGTAGVGVHDSYFTAESGSLPLARPSYAAALSASASVASSSSSSSFSSSSLSSSAPIPIPKPSRSSSQQTVEVSMQPASVSPPTGGAAAAVSSSSLPGQPLRRAGSWTMIDLMPALSADSPPSGSPVQLEDEADGAAAGAAASAAGSARGSGDGAMAASWTAGWTVPSPSRLRPELQRDGTAATDSWHEGDRRAVSVEEETAPAAEAAAEEERERGEPEAADSQQSEEDRLRDALRCERLMAVRTLFLQSYHSVLPVSASNPVAPILPNSPVCPHFDQARQTASQLPTTETVTPASLPAGAAHQPAASSSSSSSSSSSPALPPVAGVLAPVALAVPAAAAADGLSAAVESSGRSSSPVDDGAVGGSAGGGGSRAGALSFHSRLNLMAWIPF